MVWLMVSMAFGAGLLALPHWVPIRSEDLWLIAGVGIAGALGQYTITEAFRQGEASLIAPLEYSALLWGEDYLAWSTSSTSAGLYPSFYLGWGPAAVLLGSAVLGAVWALAIFAGQRAVGRYFELVFWITMLPYAIRLDEAWSVGAISAPIITSIYLILIIWSIGTIVRAVSPVRDALR